MRDVVLKLSVLLCFGLALHGAQAQTLGLASELSNESQAGKALVVSREGQCTLCHRIPDHAGAMGDLGPSLGGVATRLSAQAIEARVKDSRSVNPHTIMPPYFSTVGLSHVDPKFKDQTLLTQAQLQQILAYLATLK